MTQQTRTPTQDYSSYDDSFSNNYSGDSSTYDEKEQELLRFQLDVRPLLDDFEHRVLRGEYEYIDVNSGERKWRKFDAHADSIINEIGIREIMGRLLGYGNIATKLSYYEEEEIYKNMFYFDMSLTELIAKRSDYWKMDIETAKTIKDAAIELIQSILFSARKGFTAINLRTQYSRQDVSRSDASQGNQRTFLGIPIGGKK